VRPDPLDTVVGLTPWVVRVDGTAGPALVARDRILVDEHALDPVRRAVGDGVTRTTAIPELGVVELGLATGADVTRICATVPGARPVHVFTAAHTVVQPRHFDESSWRDGVLALSGGAAVVGQEAGLPPVVTEVDLARWLVAAAHERPVLLVPYAGWATDDRLPRALHDPFLRPHRADLSGAVIVPAGDAAGTRPMWPAAVHGVYGLEVLAVTRRGARRGLVARSANRGPWVDLAAAGNGPGRSRGTAFAAARVAAALTGAGDPVRTAHSLYGIVRDRHPSPAAPVSPAPRDGIGDDALITISWSAGSARSAGSDLRHDPVEDADGLSDRWELQAAAEPDEHAAYQPSADVTWPDVPAEPWPTEAAPAAAADDGVAPSAEGHWVVSTSVRAQDDTPLPRDRTVSTTTTLRLRLDLGSTASPDALEDTPARLPLSVVPPGTELEVHLHSLDPDLVEVTGPGMHALVVPVSLTSPGVGVEFGLSTGDRSGSAHLRLMIYGRGSLLQSRLVTLEVSREARAVERGIAVVVDYTVCATLAPEFMTNLRPVDASFLVNTTDGGMTHDLVYRVPGAQSQPLTGAIKVDGGKVGSMVERARAALRTASWGTAAEAPPPTGYRYEARPPEDELVHDLIELARAGSRLWSALVLPVGTALGYADTAARAGLRAALAAPGSIEVSSREALQMTLPVALVYDHPLDDGYTPALCDAFLDAYRAGTDLHDLACFSGSCPHQADEFVVCPSGFWGLRHGVTVPRSVAPVIEQPVEESADQPDGAGSRWSTGVSALEVVDQPQGLAASTTDNAFTRRKHHLATMETLFAGRLLLSESRQKALKALSEELPHVVYFFCHGFMDDFGYPSLGIGAVGEPALTLNNFAEKIRWSAMRPLVFLNGCGTTVITPQGMHDLVSTLQQECGAAGVVGTEITVFENTAVMFAEAFHQAFVVERQDIGEATRRARLRLLGEGNPLGLVYTPFASAGLRLVPASAKV
jgi:hypothetical protein